ncbi:hypothetical protein [Actinomadura fibrosa]|uniref:Uncharacterized protein n=1 Tax=Actinomadura fibrosa TaxID=111802 RepID=A0ABW2XXL8_9ACTN|nr:hypothetical protein [Actinomadura fibrosa]
MAGGLWKLDHGGHRLEIETERTGWTRVARLTVDGEAAGEATGDGLVLTVPYGAATVRVTFDLHGFLDGQAARCELAPPEPKDADEKAGDGTAVEAPGSEEAAREALRKASDQLPHRVRADVADEGSSQVPGGASDLTPAQVPDEDPSRAADRAPARVLDKNSDEDSGLASGEVSGGPARQGVPFVPPAGSRAAKREALALAHPVLYASRHVVIAIAKVLFPLLGIGALVKVLLSMVPKPDVDLPKVNLPDIPVPDVPLPHVPWPDLPDLSLPPWVRVILVTAKLWIPILIAVGVAAKEARRRMKQREASAANTADGASSPDEARRPADAQKVSRSEGRRDRSR